MISEHMSGQQFCRDMYRAARSRGMTPKFIADYVGRSEQTLRRYMSAPGTASAMKPPVEVTDRLVKLIDLTTNDRREVTMDQLRDVQTWCDVAIGGRVPRSVLASISGLDTYLVAWVGRTHPLYGVVPTPDMTARAVAMEALLQNTGAGAAA